MTTTPTVGAAIQRYKIGYHADEWGQRSSTPSGIPDASGSWVRYADHVTALAAGQATAPQQEVPDECFPGEPKVAVPQGLIGAACFAIRNNRNGSKVLEQLRRYSVGDQSQPLAPQPSPTAQADNVQEEAARYRLLRRCKGQEHEPPFTVQHEIDGTLWGGDLDAAIDEARKHDQRADDSILKKCFHG